ncbi:MAG: efflux RND transporter periplasmic adaptor subunit [Verrucomicrobia bacterium]|nr:efflux RND transporter periplasmic adaptor subunit [Verrucomicrobiota bacterium]
MSYRDHPSVFSPFHSTETSKARELRPGTWAAFLCAGMLAVTTLSGCHKEESGHSAKSSHKEESGHHAEGAHKEEGGHHAEGGHKEEGAHHAEGGEEEESQLVLTKPIVRDTVISRDYVCQISSCRNIEIRALERGYLEKVKVNEGQLVNEGDVMFTILPRVYSAVVKSAEAEAQVARVEFENTKRLLESNVVSDKELTMAKAKLDQKMAEVNLSQTHLGFTTIKAPFSGLMDRLRLRNGSLVEVGDLLTTLSDNSEMWIYFNVPEADYLEYASHVQSEESKQVSLVMANGKLFDQKGRVNVIEGEFNNKTGTIPFRADFPNPKRLLRHGETGNIRMERTLKKALLLPQKSTFEIGEERFIFVVGKDDVIKQSKIEVAEELEDLYVVTSGVTAEDRIIFEGQRQAHDGDKAHDYKFEETKDAYANLKLHAQ